MTERNFHLPNFFKRSTFRVPAPTCFAESGAGQGEIGKDEELQGNDCNWDRMKRYGKTK